ncbi:carbamoyltransferase HypF [Candidatus Bathyarchaeota archaeon]|nr:carbamoyltransferase HypF [Candidatus Bathyarchaeota archaeon]
MQIKVNVRGIVQGVGFRPFIYRIAVKNCLKGYVRNRGDAGVEIVIDGSAKSIRSFLRDLKEKKPPLAQIYQLETTKLQGTLKYEAFSIHRSSSITEDSGSVIPPDIAICDECLKELRKPEDPRHNYFFITCTDCGPRYTIIEKLPYDRENTTMQDFPMCSFCQSQYADPLDRRFHAQTVACPHCGPKAFLTTNTGEPVNHADPIREAGKLLQEGYILAIKGYGGFHVAASTTKDKPLIKLRRVKHRSQKPFAIMARDLKAVRSFAKLSRAEARLLLSYARPIVLLNKSEDYSLSSLVAPQLHNVGVMLPYTGLHYMLFDKTTEPAFVMTSANPPNQPIIKDNEEALRTLGETVDYFLFHNREIAHRCDDSVIRMHGENSVFIRRSRGYAPAPITLRKKAKRQVLSLGGELNTTVCILHEDKAFLSQHIGDVENVETRSFLENATSHLIHLTNSKIESVACDLHPKFITTKLAQQLAEKNRWHLVQVQHHHAHAAALMAEHNVDDIVCVCCDGYGYGADGEAWGGEILFCRQEEFSFKRLSRLEEQPLVGGDLATRFPIRIAAGALYGKTEVKEWLLENSKHLPHGRKEAETILNQLEKETGLFKTTSCGRILDATAAILGVCYERTYEGEPAMKLESIALQGKRVLKQKPKIKNDILDTTEILAEVFEKRNKHSAADLACSIHIYLAEGLAELAVAHASVNNVKTIGFSGGAACNQILTSAMRRKVEAAGMHFLVHKTIPPGDGGVSFGQAVAVGFSNLEP